MRQQPVLVIGAGPTGLTLACELTRHGAPVRIIDKLPAIVPWCRATGIHSRSLEIFRDLGIVDDFLAMGLELCGMNQYADGKRFAHSRYVTGYSPYPVSTSSDRTDTLATAAPRRRRTACGATSTACSLPSLRWHRRELRVAVAPRMWSPPHKYRFSSGQTSAMGFFGRRAIQIGISSRQRMHHSQSCTRNSSISSKN